jgi:hypothetical protein
MDSFHLVAKTDAACDQQVRDCRRGVRHQERFIPGPGDFQISFRPA